ncbi:MULTISPECIES: GGDEF domain-containing protein [Sphingobium]|uniref:diguanylate cyclase n=1 Tax=Sphingobium fuliginis ATCC 27551 TaxID=1208342 RepID=A0A5B8CAD4_SPHSA|nr:MULTISPECIES: GGDEF domain-containing protein [Sphingobium]MCB4859247.1 GGDEF domain-containing protein [Sphingobium sp. PNB]QDC36103.1 GGDEF domain-containing protein [Sphingobium fuliginis ATCC 27551]UXC91171.1 GGDEF domain-containing protein [Sphingobium sp. RSMS]
MGENFAFFLPVMMASFGVVFAFVWTLRVRAAGYWSAAFFCVAGGFAVPAGFALVPTPLWGFLADLLFASGFLLFSQALLERWRPNWLLRVRIAIWALSVMLCAVSLMLDNLPFELAASDFGCFLLIGLPLIAGRDRLDNWSDRTLFGAATLVALDNLIRGSTVPLTLSGGSFLSSDYAFLMQALACVLGLFLALAALAANMLDLLARYQRDALHDPLSGLLNRRGFDDAIGQRARKLPTQGSLIVCDIDHFKSINDAHGHALGDRVIVTLARILVQFAPAEAITARFGGEEFILFLPDADAARAATVANDIRESIAQEVARQLGLSRPLTASFGLSAVQSGDAAIHDAIARADAALYEAKTHGRNRVCVRRALAVPDKRADGPRSRAQSG